MILCKRRFAHSRLDHIFLAFRSLKTVKFCKDTASFEAVCDSGKEIGGRGLKRKRRGRMKKTLVLLGCLVAVGIVHGDIIPSFVSATPSGGNTVWAYKIDITTGEQVTTGDFFTIYDFGPLIAGSNMQPSGWTFSSSLLLAESFRLTIQMC